MHAAHDRRIAIEPHLLHDAHHVQICEGLRRVSGGIVNGPGSRPYRGRPPIDRGQL